jgi:hypothetical protein
MLDFKRAKFSRQDAGVTINKMPAIISTKCRRLYQQNAGDTIKELQKKKKTASILEAEQPSL